MRITSIGGGPGGLYAAILLARAGHHVTVFERNAPQDTFGFGVVFSAATLGELEDADGPSYEAIMRACARWDPVDIHYRGVVVRARGNRFAAISRKALLQILQRRAAEVGVTLAFSTEVDPAQELDADLVIGADGVNSATRDHFAEAFGPSVTSEGGKFIWLGTTKPLDSFTFIFRETAHGWLQVHAYPYEEAMSTWIVECDAQTWRDSGLDHHEGKPLPPGQSDERSIALLGQVFADDLDGHPLVANNSKWLDWRTVRTRSWRHRNVVLLGDACHTAHFSIGSGTKLAMEDAIALARALYRERDRDAALTGYEADRRPVIERWQEAAGDSMGWFARYPRYTHFAPPQFAYGLLGRSGRVTYDNVRARDPWLLGVFERWFAGHARAQVERVTAAAADGAEGESTAASGVRVPLVAPPPAAAPLRLRGVTLRNRIVVSPEADFTSTAGVPSRGRLDALTRLCRGGAGLVLVDLVAPAAGARVTLGDAGLWRPDHRAWLVALCEAAHADGALVGVQLVHAGARGATRPRDRGIDRALPPGQAWPIVAASARPYTARSHVPAALDRTGMDAVVTAFAQAADLAGKAGADLVEVHAAHGYLLAGFCSPLTNNRDDGYGGDLDARLRFPLEVVAAVRTGLPADRVVSVCLSASDLQPGGTTADDAVRSARRFAACGADVFRVVAGQTTPRFVPDYAGAYQARWSDLVRNVARVPTIAAGGIPTPWAANDLLAAGKADLCLLDPRREADPDWLEEMT